jgi:hypothetical protein
MLQQLDGHVPSDLPAGFGLVGLWDGGGGRSGDPKGFAMWLDASCRNISVTTWTTADPIPEGPRVGLFTLVSFVPPTCPSPGPRPCFAYRAHVTPGLAEVDIVGVRRAEADEIVRSIG